MHIYAFGSICRGEADIYSDVDLLAVTNNPEIKLDPNTFSIYSNQRLESLWMEGNPFAWHLASESKLIFSFDGKSFIENLGKPASYQRGKEDCEKFSLLFNIAKRSLDISQRSYIFELSNIYLAVRNFATCFSLAFLGKGEFSRFSAIRIGEDSLKLSESSFNVLQRARFLNTRGIGAMITEEEFEGASREFEKIAEWMHHLINKLNHG